MPIPAVDRLMLPHTFLLALSLSRTLSLSFFRFIAQEGSDGCWRWLIEGGFGPHKPTRTIYTPAPSTCHAPGEGRG